MKPTCGCVVFVFLAALATISAVLARPADPPETQSALASSPDGWVDLLAKAGPDLKSWTRGPIPPGKAKLQERSQWSIDTTTGNLVCEGDGGHEWLRWDEELGDAIFHVEWRFTPRPGKKGYNSGVFVRNSADATIWHQAQTGDGSGGYLFGDTLVDGKLKRVNLSKQVLGKRVKPAGDWNVYELTCKGKEIALWVNGATTSVFDACEVPKGYVGLEAEGWRIEFKNVKVKKLGP
jgi:hypothetical protein